MILSRHESEDLPLIMRNAPAHEVVGASEGEAGRRQDTQRLSLRRIRLKAPMPADPSREGSRRAL